MSDAFMSVRQCQCGCGEDPGLYSLKSSGGRAGRPKQFVRGHHSRRTEPRGSCSVDGCGEVETCRGLCRMHYSRLRKRGVIGGAEAQRVTNEGQTCAANQCSKEAFTRGYCKRHYYYVRRYGVPERPPKPAQPVVERPPNPCRCGCGRDAGYFSYNNTRGGIVKGTARSFIRGHHSRLPEYQQHAPPFDECYTVQPDGCWRWNTVHGGNDGYGRYHVGGRTVLAYRYSYERANGPTSPDARLDHTCHDPKVCRGGSRCPHRACVNPAHLEIVTHAENCRRGANAKLDATQAAEIRRRRAAGERGVDLAREFGVRPSTISWIHRGLTWASPAPPETGPT